MEAAVRGAHDEAGTLLFRVPDRPAVVWTDRGEAVEDVACSGRVADPPVGAAVRGGEDGVADGGRCVGCVLNGHGPAVARVREGDRGWATRPAGSRWRVQVAAAVGCWRARGPGPARRGPADRWWPTAQTWAGVGRGDREEPAALGPRAPARSRSGRRRRSRGGEAGGRAGAAADGPAVVCGRRRRSPTGGHPSRMSPIGCVTMPHLPGMAAVGAADHEVRRAADPDIGARTGRWRWARREGNVDGVLGGAAGGKEGRADQEHGHCEEPGGYSTAPLFCPTHAPRMSRRGRPAAVRRTFWRSARCACSACSQPHRSSGVSPLCSAMRATILGLISSRSWKAKTRLGQPGRGEDLVRAGLALDRPADAQKCGEDELGAGAGPVAHAAAKEMFRYSRPASSFSSRSATTRRASACTRAMASSWARRRRRALRAARPPRRSSARQPRARARFETRPTSLTAYLDVAEKDTTRLAHRRRRDLLRRTHHR